MKVKQSPDDFRVEELTERIPTASGPFAFYRLDKSGWTTPDALKAIRRRWQIPHQRFSYGGLKDRHANTTQYLTIEGGPAKDFSQSGIHLHYLGQLEERYSSKDIRANRFTLILRSLASVEIENARQAVEEVAELGVPNYFDDQRFGSVPDDHSFVAREMVRGDFEAALKLALMAPYAHDRALARREKATLKQYWGNWSVCKSELPRGHARSLVDYLIHHPKDFRGAVARLRPELQGLYLSAWQSHLWNQMLAEWLKRYLPTSQLCSIRLRMGWFPMPRSMPQELRARWDTLELPLPSARLRRDSSAEWSEIVDRVLSKEGLTLETMKIRGLQKPFFSRGNREATIRPTAFLFNAESDERHAGRQRLNLQFELPRGAYATMVIKRLTATKPMPNKPLPHESASQSTPENSDGPSEMPVSLEQGVPLLNTSTELD